MNKDQLIQLLAQQIARATGLDGVLGLEAATDRKQACDEANKTISKLVQLGLTSDQAIDQAEQIQALKA